MIIYLQNIALSGRKPIITSLKKEFDSELVYNKVSKN